jgi:hypothetical protein
MSGVYPHDYFVPIRGFKRAGEEDCIGGALAWQLGLPRSSATTISAIRNHELS